LVGDGEIPFQVPGARCQVPGARCQVPGARCQGRGQKRKTPDSVSPAARGPWVRNRRPATGNRQPATGNRQWRISRDAGSLIVKTEPWRVVSWEKTEEGPRTTAAPSIDCSVGCSRAWISAFPLPVPVPVPVPGALSLGVPRGRCRITDPDPCPTTTNAEPEESGTGTGTGQSGERGDAARSAPCSVSSFASVGPVRPLRGHGTWHLAPGTWHLARRSCPWVHSPPPWL
jgi:hypothetical protein